MRGRISPPFSTVPPRFCDSDELPAYTTIPLYFPQGLFLQKRGTALLRSLSKIPQLSKHILRGSGPRRVSQ